MGKLLLEIIKFFFHRIILSCEGQTADSAYPMQIVVINHLPQGTNISTVKIAVMRESSPLTRGKCSLSQRQRREFWNIPSYEGQTLSVYAAFSRLKHLVVQIAQMSF